MHVTFGSFEFRVTQVTPENTPHAEFMSLSKRFADLSNLSRRLFRTKVDRCPHGHSSKVISLPHRTKQNLIEFIWQREKFVVVDLYDERNPVSIFSRHSSQHTESGCNGVAASFECQFDDICWVEVLRIGCERSTGL